MLKKLLAVAILGAFAGITFAAAFDQGGRRTGAYRDQGGVVTKYDAQGRREAAYRGVWKTLWAVKFESIKIRD